MFVARRASNIHIEEEKDEISFRSVELEISTSDEDVRLSGRVGSYF